MRSIAAPALFLHVLSLVAVMGMCGGCGAGHTVVSPAARPSEVWIWTGSSLTLPAQYRVLILSRGMVARRVVQETVDQAPVMFSLGYWCLAEMSEFQRSLRPYGVELDLGTMSMRAGDRVVVAYRRCSSVDEECERFRPPRTADLVECAAAERFLRTVSLSGFCAE